MIELPIRAISSSHWRCMCRVSRWLGFKATSTRAPSISLGRSGPLVGADMLDVVSVEVRIHHNVSFPENLMVLRARQRGEAEKLDDVERQLLLNDRDVASNSLRGVPGETQDVASERLPLFSAHARMAAPHPAARERRNPARPHGAIPPRGRIRTLHSQP